MPDTAPSLPRPELTLPAAEAAALRSAYGAAQGILEYGSGGSTVMAAEMPGKQVVAVESDPDWAAMMQAWFAQNPPASAVEVRHADIGGTENWGYPLDDSGWRGFAAYPLGVWDELAFHPDVVLVDGRFRLGCAMATAFRISRPVALLIDDYGDRPEYRPVEEFLGQPVMTGRLARFDITPQPVPADQLLRLMEWMQTP
ncbi:hypothetical protein ACX9MO_16095 [Pseudooceanicola sp. 502str34]